MSNFLNRKVAINYNSSSSIYPGWTLLEYEQDGNISYKDLTPWVSSLDFKCESLSVIRVISNEKLLSNDLTNDDPTESLRINGKLVSIGGEWKQGLKYSYLGTDRNIEIFNLEIFEVSDNEAEGCELIAAPKMEYESIRNFSKLISEDKLYFLIKLKKEKLVRMAELLDQDFLESLTVSISIADGLFSHWSPTIYTNFIKILTDECVIDGLNLDKHKPSVVGKVNKFNIVYKTKEKLTPVELQDNNKISDQDFITHNVSDYKQWLAGLVSDAVSITSSLQKSLLIPLWLIFVLLLVLLFK